jgi:RND family efflux transporter MFP subunit
MYFNSRVWVICAALASMSCGGGDLEKKPASGNVRKVSTLKAVTMDWPETVSVTGTVRARVVASISSRIMASVLKVTVGEGDRVTSGQSLIVLDARELEAGLQQAQSAVAEARGGQPEVAASESAAQAQLDFAQATLNRMQDLLNSRSVSRQEFDEAASRVKVAEASVRMAQAKAVQLTQKIQQAEQALRSATILRGYAEISAPFAGRVIAKRAEAGAMAVPGMSLLELEQESGFRMEAEVGESLLSRVRVGQEVTVRLDSLTAPISGRISEISPLMKDTSRTVTVKIDLRPDPMMRSGLFGRVDFILSNRSVLSLPASAIATQGQLTSVMVVSDGHARSRLVKLGSQRDGQVEVVSGLDADETVISPRSPTVADGDRVVGQ